MGGGYVSCGTFTGDDKSCSALKGLVEQIESMRSYRHDAELRVFLTRITAFLSGEPDSEWSDCLLIAPRQAAALKPYLEDRKQSLIADLGTSDPFDAIEKDRSISGLDPVEAKWGKGKGWRLYCVTDLLRAIDHSEATGEVICISFD